MEKTQPQNRGETFRLLRRFGVFFKGCGAKYLGGILYGTLCESRASEQAARRSAMDSATQNAEDMIADLSLKFNRARQASITQEITEIVAGS